MSRRATLKERKSPPYRWTLEVVVAADLVADGFDFTDDRIADLEMSLIQFAREGEVTITVKKWPDAARMAVERGEAPRDVFFGGGS